MDLIDKRCHIPARAQKRRVLRRDGHPVVFFNRQTVPAILNTGFPEHLIKLSDDSVRFLAAQMDRSICGEAFMRGRVMRRVSRNLYGVITKGIEV